MDKKVEKQRASYRTMAESTKEDWEIIGNYATGFNADLPNRVLDHLRMLKDDHGGFAVDRLEHSLQTATRAYKDNRDEEYVVCALLHDMGDILGSYNHAEIAAAILKPFVSEKNHWMLNHHGIFQGYYFFHHLGLDKDMREQFRGHEHFEYTCIIKCLSKVTQQLYIHAANKNYFIGHIVILVKHRTYSYPP